MFNRKNDAMRFKLSLPLAQVWLAAKEQTHGGSLALPAFILTFTVRTNQKILVRYLFLTQILKENPKSLKLISLLKVKQTFNRVSQTW
jgi:hypothetical protein